ncbi:unnamed protein product [Eruca vesicaria subsp. sativa]|uniref:Uncharacterized protein n=1 Tax=Eruca vesicaria subsp. sativa TaxID=29727 RepID=A0ABC8LCR0_ERUVS|nr:unnamed protein product [Eruca vesicaria subsp. sativa]
MDFHSLLRRDLQFLCKINKIPANMTNLAMADALKSLETVEGLDEYMNQCNSNVLQSPTSVAKLPPSTATRTTRRKTAVKSLDGGLDQENMNKNVKFEVAKTPAARSTRKKASAVDSCGSKVQESKKGDLVQSGYSTRRSTRLLEKCMADLSLKSKETLDKPEEIEETEQEVSAQEKNPAGSEERTEDAEVILSRDLSASMEKEWEVLKNDDDTPVLEHANNTETANKESKNSETFESLVPVSVTEQAMQEKDLEPEKANTFHEETMVNQTGGDSEAEPARQEKDSETEKANTFHEETMVDQTNGDAEAEPEEDNSSVDSDGNISEADSNQVDHQEIEEVTQENDSEAEKIMTLDEDTMVETDGDSESEQEGDDSGADSDGTISEADSYQAIQGTDIADGNMILPESEGFVTAPASTLVLEEALVEAPLSPFVAESVSAQFPRPNNSAMKLVNVEDTTKENNMEMMMMNVVNGESKGEEAAKKNKKVEFDEENLKDVSMRRLVKLVKELSIKSSNNNRTALQMLPGNNQIAE